MKLTFSRNALQTLTFLRRQGYRGGGLLIGSLLGQYHIVESALPLPHPMTDLDATLAAAFETWPHALLGLFFLRRRPPAGAHLGRLVVCQITAAGERAWFADTRAPITIVHDEEGSP
jgi:hypothetical protein